MKSLAIAAALAVGVFGVQIAAGGKDARAQSSKPVCQLSDGEIRCHVEENLLLEFDLGRLKPKLLDRVAAVKLGVAAQATSGLEDVLVDIMDQTEPLNRDEDGCATFTCICEGATQCANLIDSGKCSGNFRCVGDGDPICGCER